MKAPPTWKLKSLNEETKGSTPVKRNFLREQLFLADIFPPTLAFIFYTFLNEQLQCWKLGKQGCLHPKVSCFFFKHQPIVSDKQATCKSFRTSNYGEVCSRFSTQLYIYINRLKIIQAISRSSFSVASYDSFHLLVGENYFHFYVCSALISLALDNGIKQTISGKK